MTDFEFRIQPISEAEIDAIIAAAGGRRIYADATKQTSPNVDYILGNTLIELKILEDDGFAKPERQVKLADLFWACTPARPVIVLDRANLPTERQKLYDHIVEGPIKTAVTKARRQIAQSRAEISEATSAILLVINNGYTALDQETLLRLVTRRARNDSSEIDGVVVGGCYFHSDGFDSFFLWPLECAPLRPDRPFHEFERLHDAWNEHAERAMTALMQTPVLTADYSKGPVIDTSFDVDGVTYVKPAPPFGESSTFYRQGRPRHNSSGNGSHPPVALTLPLLSLSEWSRFRDFFPDDGGFSQTYDDWKAECVRAESSAKPLQPLVPMTVTFEGWQKWCKGHDDVHPSGSLRRYANVLFEEKVKSLLQHARERTPTAIVPHRYVLAVTEVIGQDQANDVSHLAFIRERPDGTQAIRPCVEMARIGRSHALALAAAYAVVEGIECVLWQEDKRYAWQ